MIEYPPGSGKNLIIIGSHSYADFWPLPSPEEMAQWDLEIEWENMVYGSDLMYGFDEDPSHSFIYRHIQFHHALRTPGELLEEYGDSRWELVRIVPYDGYESILVLRSERK